MSHVFERYFRRHGHYPRISVPSGVQQITVEFMPGYLTISTSSPYQAKVYITRTAAIKLFGKAIPMLREMAKHRSPDHDVPRAMNEAYHLEMAILQERREQKKNRQYDHVAADRRKAQHQRWLRAQARSGADASD
jgi:hypothetical protein